MITDKLIDPKSPERRPRKAAFALPTLFTAANLFMGFLSIMKAFEGARFASLPGNLEQPNPHFDLAALLIGMAVVCDGLDGRIARMTNTVTEFGREMDSLADVITFCLAPAVLAFAWGVNFVDPAGMPFARDQLIRAGYFLVFLFLLCGAMRLARFNVQANPIPKNPGRPDRKYFVGLPTPPSAGLLAAVIYSLDGIPMTHWPLSIAWLALVLMLSFLMVSTWRYRSFKDLNLLQPRSPISVVALGSLIFAIWNYSKVVLLVIALAYSMSGIVVRVAGLLKSRFAKQPPPRRPEGATVV